MVDEEYDSECGLAKPTFDLGKGFMSGMPDGKFACAEMEVFKMEPQPVQLAIATHPSTASQNLKSALTTKMYHRSKMQLAKVRRAGSSVATLARAADHDLWN